MRSILAALCLLFSIGSHAASLRDSVGVENNEGNQLILHKVDPKESYYSISRIYNVLPKDLIAENGNKVLQIGSIVRVPTSRKFAGSAAASAAPVIPTAAAGEFTTYKVGPKETLFAISKRFNTTVDAIKQLNNLSSNSLSVGQLLKVPGAAAAVPETEPVRTAVTAPVEEVRQPEETSANNQQDVEVSDKPRIATNRLGLTERTERGVAIWIDDENLDGTKMLALHRTAAVGTIVKITNPMTGKTTFAKIVGKFTENETTKDVIIVITKATANLIGALDKRFQVSIDYGVPHE